MIFQTSIVESHLLSGIDLTAQDLPRSNHATPEHQIHKQMISFALKRLGYDELVHQTERPPSPILVNTRAIFSALLLAVFTAHTFAADNLTAKLDGEWSGSGEGDIGMRLMVMDVEGGDVAASFDVGAPGCGGAMQGLGKVAGNTLTIRPFKKADSNDMCSIKVVFDNTGNTAVVSENQCLYYHGAACAFVGKLKRKKR